MAGNVRVLVVDDSAVARAAITRGLEQDPGITVVGQAKDPFQARDLLLSCDPHVLTLDIEMPRMDGLEFLRRLMPQRPIPVVVVSSLSERGSRVSLEALEVGAVDIVCKPTRNLSGGLEAMMDELRTKVKIASTVNVSRFKQRDPAIPQPRVSTTALAETSDKVIAIGASTGGTEAIRQVLREMPAGAPGIVIVQHMPGGFTAQFARRLDEMCAVQVREAKDGDRVFPGVALVGPGGFQMRLRRNGGEYRVEVGGAEKVSGHCPSVDVLFSSVATAAGRNAVGALLTGMGADGAEGLVRMRQAGARTLAQDEASSVVWGMPRVAWEKGGAETLEPLSRVGSKILSFFGRAR